MTAILPAAGSSSRMGRPKLLLPFGSSTILGSLVDSLRRGGVDRIVLVVAPRADELRAWALDHDLDVATNPEPDRGMLSSVLVGLEELASEESPAPDEPIVVAPADLPTLSAESVRALLRAFRHLRPKLALPTFHGKRGHPLLIARSLIPDLHRLDPEIGLKQVLDAPHPVLEVELDDPGIALDVDTPDDYERLRASSRGNDP